MADPHIQVLLDDTDMTVSVREALDQIRATLDLQQLDHGIPPISGTPADARLVLTNDIRRLTNGRLEKLTGWVRDHPCPTVICSASSVEAVAIPDLADSAVSVACLCDPSRDVLAGHLSAMCSMSGIMNAMRREVATLRCREESLREKVRRLGRDLRHAGELQRDLLPHELPECDGLDIHALYRPAEVVSGDSYDVVRISPTKIALTLADATGHGMAAGLLCASFVRSLCRSAKSYCADRDVDPACVLAYLNRELCAADLSECLLVTALHAVYDETTGVVRLARAGAPYPIHLRRGAKTELVESEGPAAGMIENARFETVEITLMPGDTLVLYTDGLEDLVIGSQREVGRARLEHTKWFQSLDRHSFRRNLIELDGMLASDTAYEDSKDDLTVLALERRTNTVRKPEFLLNSSAHPHELAVAD